MTPTKPLKIAQIRQEIDGAIWAIDWYTGGTADEFVKQDVGPALTKRIERLEALCIAPRFAADIQSRTTVIARLRSTIDRWSNKRIAAGGVA
ncbi:hypothetical protein VDS42_19115 [Xanthomonas campestris pv. campestris]|nr:hypothetical protein [Xanthomonas campestris pv. campestris]